MSYFISEDIFVFAISRIERFLMCINAELVRSNSLYAIIRKFRNTFRKTIVNNSDCDFDPFYSNFEM